MEKATYMQYDFFQGLRRNGQPKSIGLPVSGIPILILGRIDRSVQGVGIPSYCRRNLILYNFYNNNFIIFSMNFFKEIYLFLILILDPS